MARAAFYLLCSCLVLSRALAQPAKPVEPALMGAVYLLDSSEQTLTPLPKEQAKVVTSRRGFAGARGSIQIPGTVSSFRLKSGQDLEFVVKCTNPESLELYAFAAKGKNREAVVSTAKGKFFGGVSVQRVGTIPMDVSKYGEASYRFAVRAPEPGEYGFVTGWSVFHFAIERK
jgi:hypothetical protein